MRNVFLTSLIALFVAAPATAQVPDYIANAPDAADYPEDDGLLLRQMVRITLDADGKVETHVEESWKMLSANLTRNDYFDPRIDYNAARSALRIDQARAYMADGTPVEAMENSFVPNTAGALQWAVPYAHLRQMTVAHVGVEHDATSVLAYTVTDVQPSGVPLWGVLDLQTVVPILDQWITIQVPEGTDLALAGVYCDVAPTTGTEGGVTSYEIHRTDVPAANVSEIPDHHQGVQRLAYSTATDWTGVRAHLEPRIEAALVPSKAVQAKTDALVEGSTFPAEKMALIHGFVIDGVRTVHWPIAAFDHSVRSAHAVLDSSVGHPLDKAVLLGAMLRSAGLDAAVALASSDPTVADVASPSQLDQAWVRVNLGDKQVWLDPTTSCDHHNRFDLAGMPTLVLDGSGSGVQALPTLDANLNRAAVRVEVDVKAGDDGVEISGTADLDLAMTYNPVVAYDRSKDRQAGVAGGIAGAFGGASVDDVFVARQTCKLTSLRTEFSGGAVEVGASGLAQLTLPRVPGAIGGGLQTFRNARTQALHLAGAPASERMDVTLAVPSGYEVAYQPGDEAIANSAGSFRRTVTSEDGELHVTTILVIEASDVTPAQWPDLRTLLNAASGDAGRKVLLRRAD
jgi:hypothetical protein